MNISEEMKERILQKILFGGSISENTNQSLSADMIGEKVLVRSKSAGVFFGELVAKNGQEVKLKNSRRIWYWQGACSVSQLAVDGSKNLDQCKIARIVPNEIIDESVEVILMSEAAYSNLWSAREWAE
jgi:hypothetical protein